MMVSRPPKTSKMLAPSAVAASSPRRNSWSAASTIPGVHSGNRTESFDSAASRSTFQLRPKNLTGRSAARSSSSIRSTSDRIESGSTRPFAAAAASSASSGVESHREVAESARHLEARVPSRSRLGVFFPYVRDVNETRCVKERSPARTAVRAPHSRACRRRLVTMAACREISSSATGLRHSLGA